MPAPSTLLAFLVAVPAMRVLPGPDMRSWSAAASARAGAWRRGRRRA